MNAAPCPNCRKEEFEKFRFNLLQCRSCLLILNPDLWDRDKAQAAGEEWFEDEYVPVTSFWVEYFESLNNNRTWKRISQVIDTKRALKVFEVGVGSGSCLNFFKKKGMSVSGCDSSKSVCEYVKKEYDIAVHHGVPGSPELQSENDIIIVNHMLEHVGDPIEFLRLLARYLRSDGVIHIAVPNVICWEAGLPGWNAYEPYHFLYFSPSTLGEIIGKAGYRIIRNETNESFSGWFLAIVRTFLKTGAQDSGERKKQKRARARSVLEHLYRMSMILSGVISYPLRLMQSALGFGDELIIIAQKAES